MTGLLPRIAKRARAPLSLEGFALSVVVLMLVVAAIAIAAFVLGGCGGLASTTPANLQNAATMTALAYRHDDAGTVHEAEDRAAHCAIQAVGRDEKVLLADAGIACQ